MSFARLSLSLAAVIGLIATALAGATIWLLITNPLTSPKPSRRAKSLRSCARLPAPSTTPSKESSNICKHVNC